MIKEKPILFSGPMVQAILEGKKTQTRRVVKGIGFVGGKGTQNDPEAWGFEDKYGDYYTLPVNGDTSKDFKIQCPYGKIGDRLWVRENWNLHRRSKQSDGTESWRGWIGPIPKKSSINSRVIYQTGYEDEWNIQKWKPSIHMPRWASRINLEITDIRVERLNDISEQDAKAEGVKPDWETKSFVDGFFPLWNSINEKRGFGWDKNPWVWILALKAEGMR